MDVVYWYSATDIPSLLLLLIHLFVAPAFVEAAENDIVSLVATEGLLGLRLFFSVFGGQHTTTNSIQLQLRRRSDEIQSQDSCCFSGHRVIRARAGCVRSAGCPDCNAGAANRRANTHTSAAY
jgi:hypothetical protein